MVGPVHQPFPFQLFQRQAQHALRNTKISLERIET